MIALPSFEPGPSGIGYGYLVLEHPWLVLMLQMGFPIVTIFELLSPLGLFYRRFCYVWILVKGAFHVAPGLFMQIWFTANFVLIVVFLTDIDRLRAAWLHIEGAKTAWDERLAL